MEDINVDDVRAFCLYQPIKIRSYAFLGVNRFDKFLVTLRSMNVFLKKSIHLMVHVVEGISAYSPSQKMEMWWRENNRNVVVVVVVVAAEIKKKL